MVGGIEHWANLAEDRDLTPEEIEKCVRYLNHYDRLLGETPVTDDDVRLAIADYRERQQGEPQRTAESDAAHQSARRGQNARPFPTIMVVFWLFGAMGASLLLINALPRSVLGPAVGVVWIGSFWWMHSWWERNETPIR